MLRWLTETLLMASVEKIKKFSQDGRMGARRALNQLQNANALSC